MDQLVIAFLQYMLDDYFDMCQQEYVEADDFPFSKADLIRIRRQIEQMVGRE